MNIQSIFPFLCTLRIGGIFPLHLFPSPLMVPLFTLTLMFHPYGFVMKIKLIDNTRVSTTTE